MYVRREISPAIIWHFAWRSVCFFILISCIAVVAYLHFKWSFVSIPFLPVATVGTAVAFYAGFKNNASYERLWEGRKIWAEIEHLCRCAAMILLKSSGGDKQDSATKKRFIYGQIAWVHSLKAQLRMVPTFLGEETEALDQVRLLKNQHVSISLEEDLTNCLLTTFSSAETESIIHKRNVPSEVLFRQMGVLDSIHSQGLSDSDYEKLLDILADCSQQQTAAERLNSFPFPRQYAHFSSIFVNIFVVLLPFALIGEIKNAGANIWLTVPFSVLISWVFYTMERVGDTSENPFENALNDIPLSSICREIEIDLKDMLGETDLPSALEPQHSIMM